MSDHAIAAGACLKIVESATRSCQPTASSAPAQANPNWDAMATSFASLSTAFMFGSLLLAVIALLGAIAWGFLVKGWAEREAKIEAERCARKWLDDEALPFIRREVREYLRTFPQEGPISETEIAAMAAAAGQERKEDEHEKK